MRVLAQLLLRGPLRRRFLRRPNLRAAALPRRPDAGEAPRVLDPGERRQGRLDAGRRRLRRRGGRPRGAGLRLCFF